MVYEELPPSYQPQNIKPRPSVRGAKIIGKKTAPTVKLPGASEICFDLEQLRAPELLANNSAVAEKPQHHLSSAQNKVAQPRPVSNPPIHKPESDNLPPSYYPTRKPQRHNPSTGQQILHDANHASVAKPTRYSAAKTETASNPSNAQQKSRYSLKKRIFIGITASLTIFIAVIAIWGGYLYSYGSGKMHTIEALSGAPDTPGTTYLIAGSDQRHDEQAENIQGKRSDTIMLLHIPEQGTPALISIPRDTYALIPEYGGNKINAAFALGGAPLLVKTVEQLSGITVDHYIEIGMDGVVELTDAVGGINLCYDNDVSDPRSELTWTAGCHDVDGKTALAFSRMRYQDPEGDIGRAKRQRQVVSKILAKAISAQTFLNPLQQKRLVGAGASILTVDRSDSLWDVGMSAFALKKATGKGGVTGTPPISSLDYHANGMAGSAVLLDPERIERFWADLRDGNLDPAKYETLQPSA